MTTGGLWFQRGTVRVRAVDAKSVPTASAGRGQRERRRTPPSDSDGGERCSVLGGEAQASSSSATLRVRFGSTWTPGPIVVETVIFLM